MDENLCAMLRLAFFIAIPNFSEHLDEIGVVKNFLERVVLIYVAATK